MEIRLRKTVGQRLVNGADDLLSAIPFDQSIQGHITRRVLTVGQVRLRRRRKRDGGEHPQRRFASAERGRSERRNGKGGLDGRDFRSVDAGHRRCHFHLKVFGCRCVSKVGDFIWLRRARERNSTSLRIRPSGLPDESEDGPMGRLLNRNRMYKCFKIRKIAKVFPGLLITKIP